MLYSRRLASLGLMLRPAMVPRDRVNPQKRPSISLRDASTPSYIHSAFGNKDKKTLTNVAAFAGNA
jgi:hypothetical protein